MVGHRGPYLLLYLVLFAATLGALQGCSNQYAEDITQQYGAVKQRLADLGQRLESGQVANALLIKTYARQLVDQKPELEEVVQALRKDATTEGPMYQGLLQRLGRVNQKPENKHQYVPAFQELEALWAAADPVIYNESLMDVVNTLADLSGGALARINIPKDAKTSDVAGTNGAVPGSYLVGNPNYGQWMSDASGSSFWQWYGQYRLFTDLLGGFGGYRAGPIYFDSWYRRPRYSYHQDYGRGTYGTYSDRKGWEQGNKRLAGKGIKAPKPKHYASVAGQRRVSTYASMRSKTTSDLRARRVPTASSRSSAVAKRPSSFFGSSSRGTASGSRGWRAGK